MKRKSATPDHPDTIATRSLEHFEEVILNISQAAAKPFAARCLRLSAIFIEFAGHAITAKDNRRLNKLHKRLNKMIARHPIA